MQIACATFFLLRLPVLHKAASSELPALCTAEGMGQKRKRGTDQAAIMDNEGPDSACKSFVLAKPVAEGRGHTGYLVFARR